MSVDVSPDDSRVTAGLMSDEATVDSRAWTTASGYAHLRHGEGTKSMTLTLEYICSSRLIITLPRGSS